MDFYSAQDLARRNSRWLVLWFVLAVLVLIGISNVLIAMVVHLLGFDSLSALGAKDMASFYAAFSTRTFGLVCLGVLSTIFLVVLFKWAQLSAGGKSVAERLGGERVLPQTEDPDERRCLNVVEEMALAAGMAVPPVYVLANERGINAFAAGVSPADAVIGITQGSIRHFNREQLQGVIGHEFSHILNGDMRLNIRLAAMLKGITFVGDVGEMLVRGGRHRGGRHYGGRSSKSKLPIQVMGIGLVLWILGWLGGLFAGFIKAAVSRQREHLADASAVQFTRNPSGVADALKVIGGYPAGTTIVEARANELSHIFFGQIAGNLWQVFRTHPPLPERIRRIQPDWDGKFIQYVPEYEGTSEDQQRREEEQERRRAAVGVAAVVAGSVLGANAEAQVRNAADANFSDFGTASPLQSPAPQLPESLLQQAHEPFGANAIAYGLLCGRDPAVQEQQFELLAATGVKGMEITVRQLLPELGALPVQLRLPLLEASLPALKCMSPPQYQQFKKTLLQITRVDQQIDLYEWCMYQVLRHYLDPEFLQVKPSQPRHRKVVHVRQEYRTVLSVLAWRGHQDEQDRQQAFTRGVESVGLYNLVMRPLEECSVAEFSRSVNKLADCFPLLKPRLLKGMARCAAHDDLLTAQEIEILVAVAAVMDCPVPAAVRTAAVRLD